MKFKHAIVALEKSAKDCETSCSFWNHQVAGAQEYAVKSQSVSARANVATYQSILEGEIAKLHAIQAELAELRAAK